MKSKALCVLLALCATGLSALSAEEDRLDAERKYYESKLAGMEAVLGPMHEFVGHAVIPFDVGGAVDMYYFPQERGTALATMELLRLEGDIPMRGKLGTYELVAFTKEKIGTPDFAKIERALCGIFTVLGNYSAGAVLNPLETCEIPDGEGKRCLVFDEYPSGGKLDSGGRRHGLLLVIQVHEDEMAFAMKYGTKALLRRLRDRGCYPFSDLDRKSVVSGR